MVAKKMRTSYTKCMKKKIDLADLFEIDEEEEDLGSQVPGSKARGRSAQGGWCGLPVDEW